MPVGGGWWKVGGWSVGLRVPLWLPSPPRQHFGHRDQPGDRWLAGSNASQAPQLSSLLLCERWLELGAQGPGSFWCVCQLWLVWGTPLLPCAAGLADVCVGGRLPLLAVNEGLVATVAARTATRQCTRRPPHPAAPDWSCACSRTQAKPSTTLSNP